tara:strand:- start:1071 stop:1526 length:456 start_codon:yes stop_codon:yes gene_type:complete
MGTRSLTRVIPTAKDYNKDITTKNAHKHVKKSIINMYRQYDGYLSGHGGELAEFLMPFTIVNGISYGEERKIANGPGCLAAQLVAGFKDGAGGIYLQELSSGYGFYGEEFIYTIIVNESTQEMSLSVFDVWEKKIIFEGTPANLLLVSQAG